MPFRPNEIRRLFTLDTRGVPYDIALLQLQVVFCFPQCHRYRRSRSPGSAKCYVLFGMGWWYCCPCNILVDLSVHFVAARPDARDGWPQVGPAESLHSKLCMHAACGSSWLTATLFVLQVQQIS